MYSSHAEYRSVELFLHTQMHMMVFILENYLDYQVQVFILEAS